MTCFLTFGTSSCPCRRVTLATRMIRCLDYEKKMKRAKRKPLGRLIVIDPEVCHGKPTFTGTRIMVEQVLRQVADGKDWDDIIAQWRGRISKEAIAEAVNLACQTFAKHVAETLPA